MNPLEPSIRVVQWFFGALIALALTHLFRDQRIYFKSDIWWVLLISAMLFARYLIGSANHMWYEYVKSGATPPVNKSHRHFSMFKDFAFLATFGFFALRITDTQTVADLLFWILMLLLVAVIWTPLDHLITSNGSFTGLWTNMKSGRWCFWLWINCWQLAITLGIWVIYRFFSTVALWTVPIIHWPIFLFVTVLIYIRFLCWDFLEQCKLLDS